jgi:hypothetical protein
MEFEQHRPVEEERVRVLGGRPFAAFELRAARGAYLDAEPELTMAVMTDCLPTVADAYSPDLGD